MANVRETVAFLQRQGEYFWNWFEMNDVDLAEGVGVSQGEAVAGENGGEREVSSPKSKGVVCGEKAVMLAVLISN